MAKSRTAAHSLMLAASEISHLGARLSRSAGSACGAHRYSTAGEHAQQDVSSKLEPYRKTTRPQSWPQIRLRLADHASRHRPTTKNRMHWDRRMEKQVQIAKDAWTRKENCWKNEQRQRSQAEERWDLRRRIAEAESDSRFLFQKQYEKQVQKRLQTTTYKPWTRSKRKAKGPADPSQEEMAPAADKPAQTPAPSTPRLNRDL